MIMKKIIYIATIGITLLTTSCDDFLDRQVPQGCLLYTSDAADD